MQATNMRLLLAATVAALLLHTGVAQVPTCYNPTTNPAPINSFYITPLTLAPPNSCAQNTYTAKWELWTPDTNTFNVVTTQSTVFNTAGAIMGPGELLVGPATNPTAQVCGAGNNGTTNTPAYKNVTAANEIACCKLCQNDYLCRHWVFQADPSVCQLKTAKPTDSSVNVTVATNTTWGASKGWQEISTSITALVGTSLPQNVASVSVNVAGQYTFACSNSTAVNGPSFITIGPLSQTSPTLNFTTPIPDFPAANLTVTSADPVVCPSASNFTATFQYYAAGANTGNATLSYNTTLPGATCTIAPASLVSNATNSTVTVSCYTNSTPIAPGSYSIGLSAVYPGVPPRCGGNLTVSASRSITVLPVPTLPTLVATSASPACFVNPTALTASFLFNSTNIGNTTFTAYLNGATGICSAAPAATTGGTGQTNVTVTCPSNTYPPGPHTITLGASFINPACSLTTLSSVNASVAIVVTPATPVTVAAPGVAPRFCVAPLTSVGATFVQTATGTAGSTFAAALVGKGACTAAPPSTPAGSWTGTTTPIAVSCPVTNLTVGSYDITLDTTYNGTTPCVGGAVSSTTKVFVDGQGAATLTAEPAPILQCPTPFDFEVEFSITTNEYVGSTSFAPSTTTSGVVCGAPATLPGQHTNKKIKVTCSKGSPIPAGPVTVTLVATYDSGVPSACAGGSSTASVTVIIPPAGEGVNLKAITPVPDACSGKGTVTVSFNYTAPDTVGRATFSGSLQNLQACVVSPTELPGGSYESGRTIDVTCPASQDQIIPPGDQDIDLLVTFVARPPCTTGGSKTAAATVKVYSKPLVTVAPSNTPSACFGTTSIGATFHVSKANLPAGSLVRLTAVADSLADAVCTVTPETLNSATAANVDVSVTCDLPAGFPTGSVPIKLSASFDGTPPCDGGVASGSNVVTVGGAPIISLVQGAAVPACGGSSTARFVFNYTVTGAGARPVLSVAVTSAPDNATCTAPVGLTNAAGSFVVICTTTNPEGFIGSDVSVSVRLTAASAAGCGLATRVATATVPLTCCLKGNALAFAVGSPIKCFNSTNSRFANSTARCSYRALWTGGAIPIGSGKLVVGTGASCGASTIVGKFSATCLPSSNLRSSTLQFKIYNYKQSQISRREFSVGCSSGPTRVCGANSATWVVPAGSANGFPYEDTTSDPIFNIYVFNQTIGANPGSACTCENVPWSFAQYGLYQGLPADACL